ncbi:MAG: DegT/DnrJ/EryC1/StrS family aminotransferase [Deltaproteobacteria bacterium]|nr:DegT/DnrJ/EryC1/StrS family aminotransferase [Deltaproteobacteria bacterium]
MNLEPSYKKGVFQLYMIKAKKRDELAAFLKDCGIDTRVHYRTYLPFHPHYRRGSRNHSLPVTERLSDEVLSLPIHENMTDTDVAGVIRCVKDFCVANIPPVGENRLKRI